MVCMNCGIGIEFDRTQCLPCRSLSKVQNLIPGIKSYQILKGNPTRIIAEFDNAILANNYVDNHFRSHPVGYGMVARISPGKTHKLRVELTRYESCD